VFTQQILSEQEAKHSWFAEIRQEVAEGLDKPNVLNELI